MYYLDTQSGRHVEAVRLDGNEDQRWQGGWPSGISGAVYVVGEVEGVTRYAIETPDGKDFAHTGDWIVADEGRVQSYLGDEMSRFIQQEEFTYADCDQLRPGDRVLIHLNHGAAAASEPRGKPFEVTIHSLTDQGLAEDDAGRFHVNRLVHWRWRDMPEELQPHKCVRDDVRGLDGCNQRFIIAVIAKAPYRCTPRPRNALYAREQVVAADRLLIDLHHERRDGPVGFSRRRQGTYWRLYLAINDTYELNIPPGVFNGHLASLVRSVLSLRPGIRVERDVDVDRIMRAWRAAGRPGYIGPYIKRTWGGWGEDDGTVADPHSAYRARVRKHIFIRWVTRNVHRFYLTLAETRLLAIEAHRWEEEENERQYRKDMESEYGSPRRDMEAHAEEDLSEADEIAECVELEYLLDRDDPVDQPPHLDVQASFNDTMERYPNTMARLAEAEKGQTLGEILTEALAARDPEKGA